MADVRSHVLVVDDEPRAVELMVRTLRREVSVETASSADEAWRRIDTQDFELVISDQRMPGLTGVDLLSRVAERDDSVGRILLTGYSDLEATVEAINRGRVHAYLHKPCSPQDLRTTVKGVLDRVRLARENTRLVELVQTQNRKLEEALESLRSAQDRIVTSERLAAIGRMIAMIVHDLRTPLSVIRSGATALVAGGEGMPAELLEQSREIESEALHVQRMCDELHEISRASEHVGERVRDELDEVVSSALVGVAENASRLGVVVETDLGSDCRVDVDEVAVRRALRNLMTNALEAMPDGGCLRIDTCRDADRGVVRITDSGVGIPDEIAERLFEPFVTAGKVGGSGLGLAIVRKVVDDHGGEIAVSKAEGGGTAFELRIPVADEE